MRRTFTRASLLLALALVFVGVLSMMAATSHTGKVNAAPLFTPNNCHYVNIYTGGGTVGFGNIQSVTYYLNADYNGFNVSHPWCGHVYGAVDITAGPGNYTHGEEVWLCAEIDGSGGCPDTRYAEADSAATVTANTTSNFETTQVAGFANVTCGAVDEQDIEVNLTSPDGVIGQSTAGICIPPHQP